MLGDGTDIGFWRDKWIGPEPLCYRYAALFDKSTQKDYTISMMGQWENEIWQWNFDWSDALTNDELAIFLELFMLLEQVYPILANSDRRRWSPNAA
jgi:hypothetical protein